MNLQMLQIVLVICSMKAFLQFVDVIIWGLSFPKSVSIELIKVLIAGIIY